VDQLAQATTQTIADVPQRGRMRQLTKQHADKLCPTGESLGSALGLVFTDQGSKFGSGKMLQQLIEQTGCGYHDSALLGEVEPHRFRPEVTMLRRV